jgi:hypothetical protein
MPFVEAPWFTFQAAAALPGVLIRHCLCARRAGGRMCHHFNMQVRLPTTRGPTGASLSDHLPASVTGGSRLAAPGCLMSGEGCLSALQGYVCQSLKVPCSALHGTTNEVGAQTGDSSVKEPWVGGGRG